MTLPRRHFLKQAAALSAAAITPASSRSQTPTAALALSILRAPDTVTAFAENAHQQLEKHASTWRGANALLQLHIELAQSKILITAPNLALVRIHLRWKQKVPQSAIVLGDAWERSYGDLQWLPLQPERTLPWYTLIHNDAQTFGVGVETGASSFAFWQVDDQGISLWLDVRNGGRGVHLGERTLHAATLVELASQPGESPFQLTQRLCKKMVADTPVPKTRGTMPTDIVLGTNDWYYAYGKNKAENILHDADLMHSLAPSSVKPFTIIDDGYQDPTRFPSLPKLAEQIRARNVIPGIWIRPLQANATTNTNLLLPDVRNIVKPKSPNYSFDPTIPEALAAASAVAKNACDWGFDLIKHDFTTFDMLGLWGSQMNASPTQGDWHFNDRSLTNAEIITRLYRELRSACGASRLILGCNTVGHLSVGLFDLSRTGDDVSGRQWERTRRMGVNTLAFRLPQHKTFFTLDPDIASITAGVPWEMSSQWLDLIAETGTTLIISPQREVTGPEQLAAIKRAFARCAEKPNAAPEDWLTTRTPTTWSSGKHYEWSLAEGETPFPIGVTQTSL